MSAQHGAEGAGKRLARILVMLPYAIRHPGARVDELAQRFGIPREELVEDLNLVFLCGLPGYGPEDLIEVDLEEDRVYVRMADYFSQPARLTAEEALSLYLGGEALLQLVGAGPDHPLRRALNKLSRALSLGERPALAVQMEKAPEDHLDKIRAALAQKRRIQLEYLSSHSGELTERKLDPWGLVAALGRIYLVAWDHLRGDERLFRVDRIKTCLVLDEKADVPASFDPRRYHKGFRGGGGIEVSFELAPTAASWFPEYYPVDRIQALDDGWSKVEITAGSMRWAAALVLRLGPEARALNPPQLEEETRRLASRIAALYSSPDR